MVYFKYVCTFLIWNLPSFKKYVRLSIFNNLVHTLFSVMYLQYLICLFIYDQKCSSFIKLQDLNLLTFNITKYNKKRKFKTKFQQTTRGKVALLICCCLLCYNDKLASTNSFSKIIYI